jgi:hypothetical protein
VSFEDISKSLGTAVPLGDGAARLPSPCAPRFLTGYVIGRGLTAPVRPTFDRPVRLCGTARTGAAGRAMEPRQPAPRARSGNDQTGMLLPRWTTARYRGYGAPSADFGRRRGQQTATGEADDTGPVRPHGAPTSQTHCSPRHHASSPRGSSGNRSSGPSRPRFAHGRREGNGRSTQLLRSPDELMGDIGGSAKRFWKMCVEA